MSFLEAFLFTFRPFFFFFLFSFLFSFVTYFCLCLVSFLLLWSHEMTVVFEAVARNLVSELYLKAQVQT